eukprot:CAMPEP_0116022340 /NCGR_PEP_ID=MMETSP0321-20121206/10930_1 /TAXON_ID=163516 /ORGANISM="Leptocylindrus danicus var. danicus, Strain B650" /LENGTH=498 /DNA_ID=CAMNT_0003493395 /DNA_START=46 /DNA_END=1542 /DNA_ORIENTATION=+
MRSHNANASNRKQKSFKAEANALVQEFVRHVTSISTVQRTLIPLLTDYTQNALNVPTLSPALKNVIIKVCNEYDRQTSFASLAFLSPPAQSAWTVLFPLTLDQQQRHNLVMDCELEHSLSCVLNPEMRRVFKESEFESIGHLLRVCKGWKWDLENIVANSIGKVSSDGASEHDDSINSYANNDSKVVEQALKDLRREVITVNGHLLKPPARGGIKAFVKLLSEALVSPFGPMQNNQQNREVYGNKKGNKVNVATTETALSGSCILVVDSESEFSSSDGNFSDGSATGYSDVGDDSECSATAFVGMCNRKKVRRRNRKEYRPLARKRKFDISTIDALTSRLCVAAGRSQQGGDAFFVVRDLFGGDDVVVVNTERQCEKEERGTIEVIVRLSCVIIKCHGSFDVYPKDLIGQCEPLIQIHTTTSECVLLQEVRASDVEVRVQDDERLSPASMNKGNEEDEGDVVCTVLRERITESSGRRILSVSPAAYVKFDIPVVNTPS